jgi:hypothetical protein
MPRVVASSLPPSSVSPMMILGDESRYESEVWLGLKEAGMSTRLRILVPCLRDELHCRRAAGIEAYAKR